MRRVGIRVDANETIATGHVMRCMAIAEELKKLGENPLFISADEFPRLLIEGKGYEFVSLGSDWRHMEGETGQLQAVINKERIEVLLVDSYYATKAYFEKIHTFTKVIYMEDLGKEVYDVDAVICYANYHKELLLEERYPSETRLLLGTKYAPLRSVFSDLPPKEISPELKRLLVLSGGTDPHDFLWKFSESIMENGLYEKLEEIYIVCGRYYMRYDELRGKLAGNEKFRIHRAVENIEKHMQLADAAVTSAGVISYELCAAGVPAITYVMADNQQKNAESFHRDGIMECAGDLRCDPVLKRIEGLLDGKYRDYLYRKKVSEAAQRKVDGRGAWRIARCMKKYYINDLWKERNILFYVEE